MDKYTKNINGEKNNPSAIECFLKQMRTAFSSAREERANDKKSLLLDLGIFAIGFVLARCHLVFGAYPLGIGFLAILPIRVWPALLGTVLSHLSMGQGGLIFAVSNTLTIFIRAIISKGNLTGEKLFGESLLLKMSASIIGGFITALLKILTSGITSTSLLFSASMILLPPAVCFVFSGLFTEGITLSDLLFSTDDVLSLRGLNDTEKCNTIFFGISMLTLLFFISLSIKPLNVFGISLSYVFSFLVTLLSAKRFGALKAMVCGFVTALGVAGIYSVSFALAGLFAGIMFGFGTGYAIISGGIAVSAWSIYHDGLIGFLTVVPEYALAVTLALPILKKLAKTETNCDTSKENNASEDMVGTMALAFQNKYTGKLDKLEMAISAMSDIIRGYTEKDLKPSKEDYKALVEDVAQSFCLDCSDNVFCKTESINPCISKAEKIAEKLLSGQKITAEDVNTDTEFCKVSWAIAESINREVSRIEYEQYKLHDSDSKIEEYEMIADLIRNARIHDETETTVDGSLTEDLTSVFENHGFDNGTIRVFGKRRKRFILAGEDEKGTKITSKDLKRSIEDVAKTKLGSSEYFRRGKMVLMECGTRRMYGVETAYLTCQGDEKEISGDTVSAFETSDDYYYGLISDGMGKGKVAMETSSFVSMFLKSSLEFGASKESVIPLVNLIIRSKNQECSATVDLFELDLLSGEAIFLKSGAAPSYVKREASIFRIRSQTAPIGLMKSIDTEKIKVEVKGGDYIVMLSDGISDSGEDAPWLLERLSEKHETSAKELAESIFALAKENAKGNDDMSVIVMKILDV